MKKFRLLFEGEIAPRQKVGLDHVHKIRQAFHPQLKRLWEQPPLSLLRDDWLRVRDPAKNPDEQLYARVENIGGRLYAPLISTHLGAELNIVFLRQQPSGKPVGADGDIDNRMKTLFDALRMPSKAEVQTLGPFTANDEQPLHCLLRDDALIHRVDIDTDRLLRDAKERELFAIIQVTIIATFVSLETMTLVG